MLSLKVSRTFYHSFLTKWCINDSNLISSAIKSIKYSSSSCNPCGPCGGASAGPSSTSTDGHRIVYKPYVPPCREDHDHKNMRMKRPMSPHLTVYAPSLPAMTSIAQRITGVMLTFYSILLAGGTLFLSNGVDTYVSMIQSLHLSGFLFLLIKFVLGFPFAYHYAFGIRFTVWNAAKCLTKAEVYSTANKAFALAGLITVFFAFLL